jgi:predicted Fe-Mo cluster-binding NifX family protein
MYLCIVNNKSKKAMTKVAIPIEKDCLSTHFGLCSHYVVFTIEKSKVVEKVKVKPDFTAIEEFPQWLIGMGVTDVVTYKINPVLIPEFIKSKINVFVGTNQIAPDLLVADYINGKLKSNEEILNS